jgi:hypothetical protein
MLFILAGYFVKPCNHGMREFGLRVNEMSPKLLHSF